MTSVMINYLTILTLLLSYCRHSTQKIILSEGTHVKLNSAYEKNNLLSVEWKQSTSEPVHVNFTIVLDNVVDDIDDTCMLLHQAEPDMDTIELMSVHQLSKRHVLVEWNHSRTDQPISYGTDLRKVLVVDMLKCRYVRSIDYPTSLRRIPKDIIVYFEEGFDVVMTGWTCGAATNCRERYDVYGKKLYDVNFLPLKFDWMTWQAASKRRRSKGLYVRGLNAEENSPTQVYHAYDEVKNLLNVRSRDQVISHAESEKWYAICGRDIYDSEAMICAQYHVKKDEVFETRVTLSSTRQLRLVGVRGLAKGGVLLFAMESDAKLVVAEMVMKGEAKIQEYELKWRVRKGSDFLVQVDEEAGDFMVVYESVEPKHEVVVQTLEFPGKDS